jgi:MFS family permease
VLFFGFFVFADAHRPWPVFAAWVCMGLGDGAFAVASQVAMYRAIPASGARPAYFAIWNLLVLVCAAAGSLGALALLGALGGVHARLGPVELGSYQVLFGVCSLTLIPCLWGVRLLGGVSKVKSAR